MLFVYRPTSVKRTLRSIIECFSRCAYRLKLGCPGVCELGAVAVFGRDAPEAWPLTGADAILHLLSQDQIPGAALSDVPFTEGAAAGLERQMLPLREITGYPFMQSPAVEPEQGRDYLRGGSSSEP